MKKTLTILSLSLITSVACYASGAVLDQSNGVVNSAVTLDGGTTMIVDQEITAGMTGVLDHVNLNFLSIDPTYPMIQFSVLQGTNPAASPTVGSAVMIQPMAPGVFTVNTSSSGITLVSGVHYLLQLIYNAAPSVPGDALADATSNPYAGGQEWVFNGSWTNVASNDLYFETYITPTAAGPNVVSNATHPTTNLKLSSWLYCTLVSGATDWTWQATDNSSGAISTRVKGDYQPNMPLAWLAPQLKYGHSYSVVVKAKVAGVWGSFGAPVTVTLQSNAPATQLTMTFSSNLTHTSILTATSITGASSYKFTITGPSGYMQTKQSTGNTIHLSSYTGLLPSTTYTVTVTEYSGSLWSTAGAAYGFSTASVYRLAGEQTEEAPLDPEAGQDMSASFDLGLYPNPVATGSSVNVHFMDADGQQAVVRMVDMNGRELANYVLLIEGNDYTTELNNSADLAPGIYLVQVSIGGTSRTEKFIVQ